ncbi:MAG: undecaprenyl-phosphate glucose phosphotransferase [Deltaproteobacteria bacterium]|nr:undecaprenyl-phosphate glucose phosphotransferase [Deltaproteobacteria bacterium]
MLRRHHRFFQSLQVLRDAVLVGVSFYLAYLGRFSFPGLLPFGTVTPRQEAIWVGLMLMMVWPAMGWMAGLYVSRRSRGVAAEFFDVSRTSFIAFMVLVTLAYFSRDERFSRGILVLWALLSVLVVGLARVASRVALGSVRSRGYNLRHVIIVGTGDLARRVASLIRQQGSLGMRAVGVVAPNTERAKTKIGNLPVFGKVSDLHRILAEHAVDQVIVALPIDKLGALKEIMTVLSQEPVDVRVIPDFYQYMTLCGSVEEFAGLPIINLQATPLVGWNLVAKRTFDIVVTGIGLVLVTPLVTLTALFIKLTSPGPVFYVQERVGMDGRKFQMFKLRTMRVNAEADGVQMTSPDDPRRTRLGSLLRRLSIDELPQLWNVMKGDMSLVGPRPERPCFIETFKRDIPRYALRHKIKAGMTGWAQVHGMRGDTSIAKRIELDLYYIENWSLLLDLRILFRTVFGGFLSPNAY